MLNKIYVKTKNFLKNNYKEIIFIILFYLIISFPLPYYIFAGGGTINLNDRFTVEDSYNEEGSYNLSYVSELKGNVITYALSYIFKWERVSIKDYQLNDNEDIDEMAKRDKLYLEYGNSNAVKLAYTKAEKEIATIKTNNHIIAIDKNVTADIKIGDILIKAEDKEIKNIEEYRDIVKEKNVGDYIVIKLIRNNKEIETKIEVQEMDERKVTGIYVLEINEYSTVPKITFNFKSSESGSSGGLMTTLAIYDSLIEDDLTNGLKIVGTGTIESDGTVGPIGGVKYKLMGAVSAKADVFIVPSSENYDECLKIKKEKGYKIKLIEASSFEQVIEELKKLKE